MVGSGVCLLFVCASMRSVVRVKVELVICLLRERLLMRTRYGHEGSLERDGMLVCVCVLSFCFLTFSNSCFPLECADWFRRSYGGYMASRVGV
jgi:hypothetical protein